MPVFMQPVPGPAPKSPEPEITPKPYKHSLVDSKKQPIETLAAYIGGSSWLVDYYSQVLGQNETLKAFDPKQLSVYQQYRKINRLEIKLQSALSPVDEQSEGRFGWTGNAIIPPIPGFIPNVHDAFIADGGEGRAIQFTIVNIQQKSFQLGTAWDIDFVAARLANEQTVKAIDSKVVEELHYVKDRHTLGLNPLIITDEYNSINSLHEYLKKITSHWLNVNYSYNYRTVIVPLQSKIIYDPFVARAITSLVSFDDFPIVREIKLYNCDDHRIPKYMDIYQAMINRDSSLLFRTFRGYQLVDVKRLNAVAYQNSVRYSGIHYILTPSTRNIDPDEYTALEDIGSGLTLTGGRANLNLTGSDFICYADPSIPCVIPKQSIKMIDSPYYDEDGNPKLKGMSIPIVPNVTYGLSPTFYQNEVENMSLFEKLCLDCIEGKPLDNSLLLEFAQYFFHWNRIEQFYLGPLLMILIRSAIRSN